MKLKKEDPIVIDQQISWNQETNACMLITKFKDGSLLCTPMSSEEAALWTAQHKY